MQLKEPYKNKIDNVKSCDDYIAVYQLLTCDYLCNQISNIEYTFYIGVLTGFAYSRNYI